MMTNPLLTGLRFEGKNRDNAVQVRNTIIIGAMIRIVRLPRTSQNPGTQWRWLRQIRARTIIAGTSRCFTRTSPPPSLFPISAQPSAYLYLRVTCTRGPVFLQWVGYAWRHRLIGTLLAGHNAEVLHRYIRIHYQLPAREGFFFASSTNDRVRVADYLPHWYYDLIETDLSEN